MSKGLEVLGELRRELEPLNREILEHPFLLKAERGELPLQAFKKFTANQLYIVFHDMKSLATLLSRSKDPGEAEFFKKLVDGDYTAYHLLQAMARELGVTAEDEYQLYDPRATAYTHYLSWLALHATPGEAAVAMTVNLPVWGSNTGRLAKALREKYGVKETGFLDFFATPAKELEEAAAPIIEKYLDMNRYRRVARTIQVYEKMFWDAIMEY